MIPPTAVDAIQPRLEKVMFKPRTAPRASLETSLTTANRAGRHTALTSV
jgi:hypothetical protein